VEQVLIKNKYARSWQVDVSSVLDNVGLRVYRESPSAIQIQVRTRTAKTGRISSVSITAAQARDMAAYLLSKAAELEAYPYDRR
jgi:hypothetical protein